MSTSMKSKMSHTVRRDKENQKGKINTYPTSKTKRMDRISHHEGFMLD